MISNIYQNRYAHLRDIIERHGGQSAVAEKLEVSKQYIGTIDQPIGGHGAVSDDATVTVPLLNVVASMGHGAVMDWEEETVQEMRFSKRWLRHNTDASSFATLAVVTAKGDSMMPTFTDGSILLVDASFTQLKVDGVYVLRRDDELFIKRIQRNLDGSFDVISDNPQYKVQVIRDPLKNNILVLGRLLFLRHSATI